MNTETISLNVMALGIGALAVFEAGEVPLLPEPRGYVRSGDNVLSARVGASEAGFMTTGPRISYPVGSYDVQFFVRAASPSDEVIRLEVVDALSAEVISSRTVQGFDLAADRQWSRIDLSFTIQPGERQIELRAFWPGKANVDLAAVRLRSS